MTIWKQIVEFLRRHPEGIDDDTLAERLGLKYRQQANSRCRQLEKEHLIVRRRVDGTICNFWVVNREASTIQSALSQISSPLKPSGDKRWCWEGNVQETVARHLATQDCTIHSIADTVSRKPGKDIVAERKGNPVWITVKGYPVGTSKTHPSTQAGHWFKQAIFDLVQYRGESKTADLGIALPDFPRYRALAQKISWFQPVTGFTYYWVQANGEVVLE
jgi:hypothetical protein